MAQISLSELARLVRERADEQVLDVTNADVEDSPELFGMINDGLRHTHNFFVQHQRHEHALTEPRVAETDTQIGVSHYTLPADFFEVLAVRAKQNGTERRILSWEHSERDELGDELGGSWYWRKHRYRVTGKKIEILPPPGEVFELLVDYTPEFQPLKQGSQKVTLPEGWWMLAVWHAVHTILTKQDRDASQAEKRIAFEEKTLLALIGRRGSRAMRVRDARRDDRRPRGVGRFVRG